VCSSEVNKRINNLEKNIFPQRHSSDHRRPVADPVFLPPLRRRVSRCVLCASYVSCVLCMLYRRLRRDQLRWLKRLKQHMALPHGREVWVWIDVVSIPQRSRDLQIKAIGSLPSYTQLCTRWPSVCRRLVVTHHLKRLFLFNPCLGLSHSCATPICGRKFTTMSLRLRTPCQAERFRPTPNADGVRAFYTPFPPYRPSDEPPFHAPSFSLR
jgi:hypothetical protein